MMKDVLDKEGFQVVKGGITYPKGIKAAGVKCGIRFNKKDLALIYSEKVAHAWGTFTTNKFKANHWWLLRKIYLYQGGNYRQY